MSELASDFATRKKIDTHLVVLTRSERFYDVAPGVAVHEPDFDYKLRARPVFTYKTFRYLRKMIRDISPDAILSFQAEYNSFVLLACAFLGMRIFVSDRGAPGRSCGFLRDIFNPAIYRFSSGIVAQTAGAGRYMFKKTRHPNIAVIGNPVRAVQNAHPARENIILNVGRMIPSKRQGLLIDIFSEIGNLDWQLVILGDGPQMEALKQKIAALGLSGRVVLAGSRKDIDAFYSKSRIFAFTSVSEGFPTALGEALNTPLASISFDCPMGPADLIEDGVSGFLVPIGNNGAYKDKLARLMADASLRESFERESRARMSLYATELIADKYYNFMFGQACD